MILSCVGIIALVFLMIWFSEGKSNTEEQRDYIPWYECDDCRELLDNCKCEKKFKK